MKFGFQKKINFRDFFCKVFSKDQQKMDQLTNLSFLVYQFLKRSQNYDPLFDTVDASSKRSIFQSFPDIYYKNLPDFPRAIAKT